MSKVLFSAILGGLLEFTHAAQAESFILKGEPAKNLIRNLQGPEVKSPEAGIREVELGTYREDGREYAVYIRCEIAKDTCVIKSWDTD